MDANADCLQGYVNLWSISSGITFSQLLLNKELRLVQFNEIYMQRGFMTSDINSTWRLWALGIEDLIDLPKQMCTRLRQGRKPSKIAHLRKAPIRVGGSIYLVTQCMPVTVAVRLVSRSSLSYLSACKSVDGIHSNYCNNVTDSICLAQY